MDRVEFRGNPAEILERVRQVAWEQGLDEQEPVESLETFDTMVSFRGGEAIVGMLVIFDPSRPCEGAQVFASSEALGEVRDRLDTTFRSLEPVPDWSAEARLLGGEKS